MHFELHFLLTRKQADAMKKHSVGSKSLMLSRGESQRALYNQLISAQQDHANQLT